MTDSVETQIAVLRTLVEESAKALVIASTELNRHLAELNNARREATEKEARFVLRESYEISVKEGETWRRSVDIVLASQAGSQRTWFIVTWLAFGIFGIAQHYWK